MFLKQDFDVLILNGKGSTHLAIFISEINAFILFSPATFSLSFLSTPIASFQCLSFSLYSFTPFSLTAKCSGECEWLNCLLQSLGMKRHVAVSKVSPLYPTPSIITEQGWLLVNLSYNWLLQKWFHFFWAYQGRQILLFTKIIYTAEEPAPKWRQHIKGLWVYP